MTRPRPYISIEEEIELDMLRLQIARELAEELVRDRGWTEKDEDFWFQIDDETKRQWNEGCERQRMKMRPYDNEMIMEDL
jgi:hypothetical protein